MKPRWIALHAFILGASVLGGFWLLRGSNGILEPLNKLFGATGTMLTELVAISSPTSDDLFYIVDNPGVGNGGTSKKISYSDLASSINSSIVETDTLQSVTQRGSSATASLNLYGAVALGGNVTATGTVILPSGTTIASKNVCLADGTNCMSSAGAQTLASVTQLGASATTTLALYGGTVIGNNLTSTGTTSLQAFTATNGTTTGFFSTALGSSNMDVSTLARFPSNTTINNKNVCLSDGTNCAPGGFIPQFSQVLTAGNVATTTAIFQMGATFTTSTHTSSTIAELNIGNATGSRLQVVDSTSTNSSYTKSLSASTTISNVVTSTKIEIVNNLNGSKNPLLYARDNSAGPGNTALVSISRPNNLSGATVNDAALYINDHSSNFPLYITNNSGSSLLTVAKTTGFVGIGTSLPLNALSIVGMTSSTNLRTDGNVYASGTGVFSELLSTNISASFSTTSRLSVTGSSGVILSAADSPFITRGWDQFQFGTYAGLGRWGLFMEPNELIAGIPTTTGKNFVVAGYGNNGQKTNYFSISALSGLSQFYYGTSGTWAAFSGNLYVSSTAVLQNAIIGGQSVCLGNGTNCIASTAQTLQNILNTGTQPVQATTTGVTIYGNVTTTNIGATGTANFQNVSLTNASGTNLALSANLFTSLTAGSLPFIGTNGRLSQNTTHFKVDSTNMNLTAGSGMKMGFILGDTNYPGIWFGSAAGGNAANFTNYSFLYGVNQGPVFNASTTEAVQFRNNNQNVATFGSSGLFIKPEPNSNNGGVGPPSDHALLVLGGGFTGLGATSTGAMLNVGGTASSTDLYVTNLATFARSVVWANATGTSLAISGLGQFGSLLVGGQTVCLANGTNCPGVGVDTYSYQYYGSTGTATTTLSVMCPLMGMTGSGGCPSTLTENVGIPMSSTTTFSNVMFAWTNTPTAGSRCSFVLYSSTTGFPGSFTSSTLNCSILPGQRTCNNKVDQFTASKGTFVEVLMDEAVGTCGGYGSWNIRATSTQAA